MNPGNYYSHDVKKLIKFLTGESKKTYYVKDESQKINGTYDYVVLDNVIGDWKDVQAGLTRIRKHCSSDTRLIIIYYNHLWEPLLSMASQLGWRSITHQQNWLDQGDLSNLLEISGFETVNRGQRMLLPFSLPFVSGPVNRWLAHLPLINRLCLTTWMVARTKESRRKDYTVSIVIPARNEEGNIKKAIDRIPRFGKWQEVIFVEGHSTDNTWQAIQEEIGKQRSGRIKVKAYQQKGKGKGDAVRLGFSKAKGEVLMILDADLTVPPEDLNKFYEEIASGRGEYVNGSRMVYPMEGEAMRTLNKLGNKLFSLLFTWILGQRFKDTLCGTKVLKKVDYLRIAKGRKFFGDFDPFGDFDLIFGAVKQNMKVVEIPIRYRNRMYGTTNISRFTHGWLLLKMTWFAFKKFRAWEMA